MLNGEQGVGPGDRWIARTLAGSGLPVTIAVNKVDRLPRGRLLAVLQDAAALESGDSVFPISARRGMGIPELLLHLGEQMPEGPFMYEPDAVTDQPRDVLLAELIREAAVRRTFREVPHAIEVVVEEVDAAREDLVTVRALIWVESQSQKGILIGTGGQMIKAIGTAARRELERALGRKVHLDLSVRVRRDWRADESLLDRLGID
jgi:GTP-binding protein Era